MDGGAPQGIGQHDFGLTKPRHGRVAVDPIVAGQHLAAILALALHIQLHCGGQRRLTEEGRQRLGHQIRLQPEVSPNLQATQASGTGPGQAAADQVARGDGEQILLGGPGPVGIEASVVAAIPAVRCPRQSGIFQHLVASKGAQSRCRGDIPPPVLVG